MLKKLFGLALALLATLAVSAQVRVGEGQLSGSFESNSIYYQDDSGLGAAGTAPDDRFGSNNYMKLDYMNGRFSAGLQGLRLVLCSKNLPDSSTRTNSNTSHVQANICLSAETDGTKIPIFPEKELLFVV